MYEPKDQNTTNLSQEQLSENRHKENGEISINDVNAKQPSAMHPTPAPCSNAAPTPRATVHADGEFERLRFSSRPQDLKATA